MLDNSFLLLLGGLVAGGIDSIAGGGGLITLPILNQVVPEGAHAIGTNKIVGCIGALVAFLVYRKHHPLHLKKGFSFVASVGVGSIIGSFCTPLIPQIYFRYLLIGVCPILLWVIWNQKIFIQSAQNHSARSLWLLILVGLGAGFYDGFFGPGGGTIMLLGLLWGVRLPLFEALLLSKLSNTISAGTSLVSYAWQGYVHTQVGITMAIGMLAGGWIGATFASQKAEKVVRPTLVIVVIGLLISQCYSTLSV